MEETQQRLFVFDGRSDDDPSKKNDRTDYKQLNEPGVEFLKGWTSFAFLKDRLNFLEDVFDDLFRTFFFVDRSYTLMTALHRGIRL